MASRQIFTEKQPLKLRHEIKHIISSGEDGILSQRLRRLFSHDENAGGHGSYRVSSLYFETPYDKALRQKLDSVGNREKFRLRYYNEDFSFIRLEKKFKTGRLCAKHSARLTREQAENILSGEIEFLLESGSPLLIEFYSKMRGQMLQPKTIVRYDREAFLYGPGNVRITVDRNLHCGLGSLDFFGPANCLVEAADGMTILEVKYDAFLPEIVRMAVQVPDRRASAFSKYAVCRRFD